MSQHISLVMLLIGLCSDQKIMCSTSVTQSIASDHFCVCKLRVAVPPDPAVYRESRNIRAINRAAFPDDLCMLVPPELCPSTDDFNGTLQSLLEKHTPLRRRRVRADRLESWYRDVKEELEAAKKHKRLAERQWVKTATTVNKQIFNAAKRLVAKIVHKAKSLFFGNEIAMSTSSRQLFNVYDKLIGRRRSSPLPSTHPLHDLPNVFNDCFLQKVQSTRADLDQQSLSLSSTDEL